MYAYLIGTLVLAAIFCCIFFARPDLRKAMVYSGLFYAGVMTLCFVVLKMISSDPAKSVSPGYWSPPSLLSLNARTGGEGIEDLMFMFFAPAIIAALYEIIFRKRISKRKNKKLKRSHALLLGVIVGFLAFGLTPLNAIYFLIIAQIVGALVLIWQRPDLLKHSITGGLLFLFSYFLLFTLFNLIFSGFTDNYYHLNRTTHIWVTGVPLEELLYAFTLGMLWAPIFEYEHQVKDSKQPSSKLRKVSLAAGATRR